MRGWEGHAVQWLHALSEFIVDPSSLIDITPSSQQ